jgi:hypothetical protein
MTLLFYAFVRKFLRDHVNRVQLIVVGDECQAVYEFNGADSRFLTRADEMFATCMQVRGQFERLSLRTSYRISKQMALFVSRSLKRCAHADEQYIVADRDGLAVNYYIGSPRNSAKTIAGRIIKEIAEGKYRAEDVFVLASSVKSKNPESPLVIFEWELADADVPIFVAREGEGRVNDDTMRGKVTFLTMNQSKGLERKVVVVFGFENSYFEFYGKSDDRSTCPSKFYVAATRAEEHLHLVAESAKMGEFPFMDRALLDRWQDGTDETSYLYASPVKIVDVGYSEVPKLKKPQADVIKKEGLVTDLIRFLPDYIIDDAMERVRPLQIAKPGIAIKLSLEVAQGELTEDVSAINGLAIPAMLEALDRANRLDQVSDLPASQSQANDGLALVGDDDASPAFNANACTSASATASTVAGGSHIRSDKDVSDYERGKRARIHASDANWNDAGDSDSDCKSSPPTIQIFHVSDDEFQQFCELTDATSSDGACSSPIAQRSIRPSSSSYYSSSSSSSSSSSVPAGTYCSSPSSASASKSAAALASSSYPARSPLSPCRSPAHRNATAVVASSPCASTKVALPPMLCSMHEIVHLASCATFSEDGSGFDDDLKAHLEQVDREIAESRAQARDYPPPCTFLRLATLYHAVLTNYKHKTRQIQTFGWLSDATALECMSNLKACIPQPRDAHFERGIDHQFALVGSVPPTDVVIRGQVDAYVAATNTVWEFKCTSEITSEHKMQLIMYAWLWLKDAEKKQVRSPQSASESTSASASAAARIELPVFKIFNILTAELWELRPTPHDLEHIAKQVIDNANKLSVRLPTEELLAFAAEAAAPRAPIAAIKGRYDMARKR